MLHPTHLKSLFFSDNSERFQGNDAPSVLQESFEDLEQGFSHYRVFIVASILAALFVLVAVLPNYITLSQDPKEKKSVAADADTYAEMVKFVENRMSVITAASSLQSIDSNEANHEVQVLVVASEENEGATVGEMRVVVCPAVDTESLLSSDHSEGLHKDGSTGHASSQDRREDNDADADHDDAHKRLSQYIEKSMSVPNLQHLNQEKDADADDDAHKVLNQDTEKSMPVSNLEDLNQETEADAESDAYSVLSQYIEKCMSVPNLQELHHETNEDADDEDAYTVLSKYIEKSMSVPNLQDLNKESVTASTTATGDLTVSVTKQEVHAAVSDEYDGHDEDEPAYKPSYLTPERSSIKKRLSAKLSRNREKFVKVPSSGSSVCSEITMIERSP